MATLKDVAKLACVDVSTVSRALNNTSYVHPETKKKIYAAVEKLAYKPNLIAKSLRQGKRNAIGVVVPGINLSIFSDIVQGIEFEARKLGYSIMICNTNDDPNAEEECLDRLRNGLVDGIIIASTGQNMRLLRDINASGISVVQMVRKQDKEFSSVVADYFACGYEGVKYLHSKGCRHIGFINGSMEIIPYKERYRGYHSAMKESGCEELIAESTLPQGNYFQDGYEGVSKLLEKDPELDAIVVAADLQGLGVLRALKERKIKVPEMIKVISLTGHSIGGMLETTMTSMEMPAKEMGARLTGLIVEQIDADAEHKPNRQHVVFDAHLVERETT